VKLRDKERRGKGGKRGGDKGLHRGEGMKVSFKDPLSSGAKNLRAEKRTVKNKGKSSEKRRKGRKGGGGGR
jgi:hypothetical protein